MKKIVAVAAAALMLAGAAFADVSFSYTGKGIVKGTPKKFGSSVERNDCLGMLVSNDLCGVSLDFDIGDANKFEMDNFYGWMTFALPVGNLQVTSGKWTARYANRVKVDAGDLDTEYFEVAKPGVYFKGITSDDCAGVDSDNLTENKMATVLAYTLADQLPGTLMVKLGAVNGVYGQFDSQAGFVGEVCWNQKGLFNANVAVKNLKKDQFSVAAFVSPLMLDKLNSMVGFTYATAKDEYSAFAVDARARYAVTEKTAVTGMINYSQANPDADGVDPVKAMWGMVAVNYVAGDNIRFVASLKRTVVDFDAEYGAAEMSFTPACEVKINENSTFTLGADLKWNTVKPYSSGVTTTLPIYFSFAL